MKFIHSISVTGFLIVSLLTACGGGDSDSSVADNNTGSLQAAGEEIQISGAGIKGPLAFADSKVFAFDPSFRELYDKNSPIATAITNQYAQISGLSVPADSSPPYILVIDGDHTIDLNTRKRPVISRLITVITADMLASRKPVYATPLTTLAFRMASPRNNAPRDAKSFIQRLKRAGERVSKVFAIDRRRAIDIFSSPVLINDATRTRARQEQAVYHRASLEAFAAKVHRLALRNKLSAQIVIERVALDLESDGVIDNAANGEVIGGIDPATLMQDPAKLSIPNTTHKIEDTITLMEEERTAIGTDKGPDLLVETISFDPPATSNVDSGSALPALDRIPVVSASTNRWQEPNVPTNIIDDDLRTRWSCKNDGEPDCYIVFDLGSVHSVTRVEIAFFQGDERMALFGLEASLNETDWTPVWPNGTSSSGTTSLPERFSVGMQARYLRYTGLGNTANNWVSANEFHVYGKPVSPHPVAGTDPAPAPAPAPEAIITLSVNSIAFNRVDIGGMSDASVVRMTNSGNAPLTISGMTISEGFIKEDDCSKYLPAGSSCTVNVRFVPAVAGTTTGSLLIDNDAQRAPFRVNLTGGTGGTGGIGEPVHCDDAPTIAYAPSGLPLMQSNPGAPIALFIDFDGGAFGLSSSGSERNYRGYNRNGSYSDFDGEEQDDIILSWTRMAEYYAMFDVNVTTDNAVREATGKWGWILITEEASGGYAAFSSSAIGTTPYARSYVGSSTARSENRDKSRRIAHELGHNFKLEHSGVWDGGSFYKWEDWPDWDGEYGTIMGGGGEGVRNGWGYGHHSGDRNTLQDSMEVIRKRVIDVGGSTTGWRKDDFPAQTPTPMCLGDGHVYRRAILGQPDDVDLFLLSWGGGDLDLDAFSVGVSTAVLDVEILKDGTPISGTNNLEAGLYELRVSSSGGYAEIGAYEIRAR